MNMPQSRRNDLLVALIHVIGWGILFGLPLLVSPRDGNPMTWNRYLGYIFVPTAFMIVFYVNYFLLIDRLLFRRRWLVFLGVNLLLIGTVSGLLHLWQGYYFSHLAQITKPLRGPKPDMVMFILRDATMMMLTGALSVAIKTTSGWYRTQQEKAEMAKERTEAELRNLKSQLNPHFLFNTLNNIYSLIAIDRDRAQWAVHSLSRLLRYVLYDNDENKVPLEQEIAFIRSYIELMKLRLAGNVTVEVSLPDDCRGVRIAPLLFITLIENAFKHGVSTEKPSFVRIRISLREDDIVICTIENSCFPKSDDDRSGSGIGMQNLLRRLNLLYPQAHSLRQQQIGGTFLTQLIVNL